MAWRPRAGVPGEPNARRILLYLTDAGAAKVETVAPQVHEIEDLLVSDLSTNERIALANTSAEPPTP